ncbi:MAG: nitrilase-related carbon-nitrogen hydrolase [Nitrospinota bacterium]
MGFKIAGVQMRCTPDKERNLKKALELGDLAAEQGARLICFQELFHTHWFPRNTDPEARDLAEPIPGPTTETLAEAARRWDAAVVAPLYERDGEGRGFNAAAVLDARGELRGVYRKVHVPHVPLWEERSYFEPGDAGFPVFDVGVARVGVLICWDVFFPEGARALALGGAQIIVAPTAAAFASHLRWETVLRAHAITNGVYVLRVNRVGSEEEHDFYGSSFCVDPEGELACAPSGITDGVVVADVDLGRIDHARSEWTYLDDRRPETYGPLVDGG